MRTLLLILSLQLCWSSSVGPRQWGDNFLARLGDSVGNGGVQDCWVCHQHPQGGPQMRPYAFFAKVPFPRVTISSLDATPFVLATPQGNSSDPTAPCFLAGKDLLFTHHQNTETVVVTVAHNGHVDIPDVGTLTCTTNTVGASECDPSRACRNFTSATCTSCRGGSRARCTYDSGPPQRVTVGHPFRAYPGKPAHSASAAPSLKLLHKLLKTHIVIDRMSCNYSHPWGRATRRRLQKLTSGTLCAPKGYAFLCKVNAPFFFNISKVPVKRNASDWDPPSPVILSTRCLTPFKHYGACTLGHLRAPFTVYNARTSDTAPTPSSRQKRGFWEKILWFLRNVSAKLVPWSEYLEQEDFLANLTAAMNYHRHIM
ncbi:uncharacterized protein LOC116420379 [Sarcophilus harrisii]|uniref:uncharacterized protein LOC116420379 n=1 Tax=Sarcophilus harrisii TaxID=9305 RepID=UPI001301BC0E|nr:uncharacterized protein LOC116420379 [Sarcophilus harrisii]